MLFSQYIIREVTKELFSLLFFFSRIYKLVVTSFFSMNFQKSHFQDFRSFFSLFFVNKVIQCPK